eukprot:m.228972 g.228972  ORF g.228972 m.228972 type:complete len:1310 (+) comp17332_c0_seq60:191-4120(+)
MGIPKYYRWISERYPCLSQTVREHEVPEFDNLYLDMNGIIHQCSHGNSDDPNFRITEEQIFKDVCGYIETLFRIIKPKRAFYMAVDGCAPRAKMNQQRARRFRTAKDAEEMRKKAEREGKLVEMDPNNPPFDSNCITPGTPFMVRLQQHLEYFVHSKITHDPAWHGVEVILSGNEVPGEGEHKIMDYIRAVKAEEGYDPNTRHCMYGLDADLIMLGLASHEPHFSLLREEVKFGKQHGKRQASAEQQTFHLLSLSMYREYLNMEFLDVKDIISFEYDFECLLDDWILLGFLVGNDFLPHLPSFHINDDILPTIYKCYRQTLAQVSGWVTQGGVINMAHLEVLMRELQVVDEQNFDEISTNYKWLEGKRGGTNGHPSQASAMDGLAGFFQGDTAGQGNDNDDNDDDNDEVEIRDAEWLMHKANYYREKMDVQVYDDAFIQSQAEAYVTGLQWVLFYYYRGVQSWSWFYPSHYAPFVSDVINIADFTPVFEMGRPFYPFEQLLSVLPPASRQHVPPALQPLMTEADSPIVDFYPSDFETDLNGKKADWEALVLIPFIDQDRLLAAMALYEPQLSPEERARNIHSNALSYSFYRERTVKMASPYPKTFPDVVAHVKQQALPFPHAADDAPPLRYLDTFDKARYYPGFPTFRFMPHTFDRRFAQVKVFSFPSKSESIVMDVSETELAHLDAKTVAMHQQYLNAVVWVRWPHLLEARVVGVSSEKEKYILSATEPKQPVRTGASGKDVHAWRDQANYLRTLMLSSRGLDIGDVQVILHVQLSQGYQDVYTARGTVIRRRVWSRRETQYPLQVCLKDLVVHREEDNEAEVPMTDRLEQGAEFCFLGHPYYGHLGHITSLQADVGQVSVEINPRSAPYVQDLLDSALASDGKYFNLGSAAHMLRMPTHLLNRIIGDIFVYDGTPKEPGQKLNAGLRLKFNRRNEQVIGMTQRRADGQWYISQRAVQLLQHYQQSFPQLFQGLIRAGRADNFYAQLMFRDQATAVMQALRHFVKTDLKTRDRETVPVGTQVVPKAALQAMEERLDAELASPPPTNKPVKVAKVHPKFLLLQHTVLRDGLGQAPDEDADFQLGDRVVCVRAAGSVPWAAQGYLVGIFGGDTDDVEVLFDECFMGAIDLGGRCKTLRGYRLPSSFLVNLTYGMRKTGQKVSKPRPAQPKQAQQQRTPRHDPPKSKGKQAATTPAVATAPSSMPASAPAAAAKQLLAALHAKGSNPKAVSASVTTNSSNSASQPRRPSGPNGAGFAGRQARQARLEQMARDQANLVHGLDTKAEVEVDGVLHNLDEYADLWDQLQQQNTQ